MNIITIDKFVPEKICQAMVEGFDAANAENTLTYYRGDNINCIEVDMLNQSKNGVNDQVKQRWKHYIKEFTNATKIATNKWLESMNDEELKHKKIVLEKPKVQRYDPQYGMYKPGRFYDKRIASIVFFLNDVKHGGKTIFKIGGKKVEVKPKMGQALIFPASKEYVFEDKPCQNEFRYVIRTHICEK